MIITPEMERNLKQSQRIYREPIKIQKRTRPEQREDGAWSNGSWKNWKKVYANVKNLRGGEYFQAGQVGKQATVKFFIRYMPGIDNQVKEDYRIIYRDTIYNIDFVDDINYQDEELEIKAIERRITDGSD